MSITGINTIDNTITGDNTFNVDTLAANSISLNGSDLQTEVDSLQSQINTLNNQNGGGYFVLTCEFNGNSANAGYFAFGGGTNTNQLSVVLPNCTCIGIRGQSATAVLAGGNIVFQKNGVAVNALGMAFTTGVSLVQNLATSATFVLGDTISVRFNNAGGSMGGTAWRATYIFQTAPVNGTNGTNGTNGSNGQNVSFYTPTLTQLNPTATPYVNDTVTSSLGTQNHQLNFGINRGRSAYFTVGTVSSTTSTPAVTLVANTDTNGDTNYTMNMILQQGAQGTQGPEGPRGDRGDNGRDGSDGRDGTDGRDGRDGGSALGDLLSGITDLVELGGLAGLSATVVSQSSTISSHTATLASHTTSISNLDFHVGTLEGEMDTQQTKTQYIGQYATETTIGGAKTIISSTNGLQSNAVNTTNLTVTNTVNGGGLNIHGDSYIYGNEIVSGDIQVGDTRKLLTNQIFQRQYPAEGNILLDATNLNIGSNFTASTNLKGDSITLTTNNASSVITLQNAIANTDVNVLIKGSTEVRKNLDIQQNLLVEGLSTLTGDLTAGTAVNYVSSNNHLLRGTTAVNTLTGISNQAGQNILHIGNHNDSTYIDSTLVDIEASDITISSDLDYSEITIGSILDKQTHATINTRDINIGTNAIGMTNPTMNLGTYSRTTTQLRGETIEVKSSETTSISGSSNLVLNATAIDIGNSTGDVNIKGATIDIGTSGFVNTINVGNASSIVNISTGAGDFINFGNFVNQLGF